MVPASSGLHAATMRPPALIRAIDKPCRQALSIAVTRHSACRGCGRLASAAGRDAPGQRASPAPAAVRSAAGPRPPRGPAPPPAPPPPASEKPSSPAVETIACASALSAAGAGRTSRSDSSLPEPPEQVLHLVGADQPRQFLQGRAVQHGWRLLRAGALATAGRLRLAGPARHHLQQRLAVERLAEMVVHAGARDSSRSAARRHWRSGR